MIKCDKLVVKQLEDIISEKSNCHDVKHFMILALTLKGVMKLMCFLRTLSRQGRKVKKIFDNWFDGDLPT